MKRKHNPRSSNLTRAAQSKGGQVTAAKRRAKAMAQLQDMTPMEIFRRAYRQGWHQGARSARRRMVWKAA